MISTKDTGFFTLDIKYFYYNMAMKRYKCLNIRRDIVPDEIAKEYNLNKITLDGWVYMEIRKVIPVLKQSGKISTDQLIKHLSKYGYDPAKQTP